VSELEIIVVRYNHQSGLMRVLDDNRGRHGKVCFPHRTWVGPKPTEDCQFEAEVMFETFGNHAGRGGALQVRRLWPRLVAGLNWHGGHSPPCAVSGCPGEVNMDLGRIVDVHGHPVPERLNWPRQTCNVCKVWHEVVR
jgi:hypothetical protein